MLIYSNCLDLLYNSHKTNVNMNCSIQAWIFLFRILALSIITQPLATIKSETCRDKIVSDFKVWNIEKKQLNRFALILMSIFILPGQMPICYPLSSLRSSRGVMGKSGCCPCLSRSFCYSLSLRPL